MSIGVYKITNIVTGKFYIGSSKTLHTTKNLFEISNWTFSTNSEKLRDIESSNIIIKKLVKFLNNVI